MSKARPSCLEEDPEASHPAPASWSEPLPHCRDRCLRLSRRSSVSQQRGAHGLAVDFAVWPTADDQRIELSEMRCCREGRGRGRDACSTTMELAACSDRRRGSPSPTTTIAPGSAERPRAAIPRPMRIARRPARWRRPSRRPKDLCAGACRAADDSRPGITSPRSELDHHRRPDGSLGSATTSTIVIPPITIPPPTCADDAWSGPCRTSPGWSQRPGLPSPSRRNIVISTPVAPSGRRQPRQCSGMDRHLDGLIFQPLSQRQRDGIGHCYDLPAVLAALCLSSMAEQRTLNLQVLGF